VVTSSSVHGIPTAAPGQLTAVLSSALPVAKSLEIPRLLNSAEPPPLPAPATLYDHGIGTRVDSHH
jgi:hypothetical protein